MDSPRLGISSRSGSGASLARRVPSQNRSHGRRRWGASGRGRGCEEAPPAAVGPLAAPEFAVGRGLGFAEWDRLVHRWPDAGQRAMDDHIAFTGHHDAFLRDYEAIAFAATPFAGGVAVVAAADPAVVG